MRRSSRTRGRAEASLADKVNDSRPEDGAFQAMDQVANWVRFADTKATILTAGFGVVLTFLMAQSKMIFTVMKHGAPDAYIVGILAGLALIAGGYTLTWLVRAIDPQRKLPYPALNRFAWPSTHKAATEQLLNHSRNLDFRAEAWQQVIHLSTIASRKFDACGKALRGFAWLVIFGVACIATATGFTILR